MDYLQAFLNNSIVKGAIAGTLAAAAIDFAAFRQWKSFDDFTTYDWKVATFRWVQGAVVGALTTMGLSLGE